MMANNSKHPIVVWSYGENADKMTKRVWIHEVDVGARGRPTVQCEGDRGDRQTGMDRDRDTQTKRERLCGSRGMKELNCTGIKCTDRNKWSLLPYPPP